MEPDSIHLTEAQQSYLEMTGGTCKKEDGRFYVYWPDFLNSDGLDDWDIDDALSRGAITATEAIRFRSLGFRECLRDILFSPGNSAVECIEVSMAWTCDKMRPGAFGGSSIIVSRTEWCDVGSYSANYDPETKKIGVHVEVFQWPSWMGKNDD